MPGLTGVIGNVLTAYVPDVDDQITLGYTGARFYVASSENGSYSLVSTSTLVSGTLDYSYNHTTGGASDWWYWQYYGATPGAGPASETQPVGRPRLTRLVLRQAVGKRLQLMDVFTLASVSSSTVAVVSELIDPDASAHRYANRWARCSAGTAIGQTRRVRSGATGYAIATGALTVNRAFSAAWLPGDSVELWKPRNDEDTSVMVDNAMQDARRALWWTETFYLTIDSEVTEYVMPASLGVSFLRSVEYCRGTYPSIPDWSEVPFVEAYESGLQTYLTVGYGPQSSFDEDTIIRVQYARCGDRMDSDTDYWEIDQEWAENEIAAAYLRQFIRPGGNREDISDARAALNAMEEDLFRLRRIWMPAPRSITVPPR